MLKEDRAYARFDLKFICLRKIETSESFLLSHSSTRIMSPEKRITYPIPSPTGVISGEDLDFKALKEDANVYELEDGTILRVRIVAGKISRGIDPATNSIYYLPDGEPLYNVRYNVVITAEVPQSLRKK